MQIAPIAAVDQFQQARKTALSPVLAMVHGIEPIENLILKMIIQPNWMEIRWILT